jgi:hypothetical protein
MPQRHYGYKTAPLDGCNTRVSPTDCGVQSGMRLSKAIMLKQSATPSPALGTLPPQLRSWSLVVKADTGVALDGVEALIRCVVRLVRHFPGEAEVT